MGWRSIMITQPSYLSYSKNAIQIRQGEEHAHIPLEDISVIVLDNPQITLTGQLLAACADKKIAIISVGADHHPNGLFLPFLSHHRTLKVMRKQLNLSLPSKKQFQQQLVRQKILNQSAALQANNHHDSARRLQQIASDVRSGDPDNFEAQAAQFYFRTLFGKDFMRQQPRFYNAALNFSYAVLRATLARTLVSYGFLPSFGLFNNNEQNAFNLADDLIEPFRPFADHLVMQHYTQEPEQELQRADKTILLGLLHRDTALTCHSESGMCTLLAATDQCVASLTRAISSAGKKTLDMPCLTSTLARLPTPDEP